eukprot:1157623-Pelagomonas_calceolata.AAC.5
MQPCPPKGQGSLFDMGSAKAEGFGAARDGGQTSPEEGLMKLTDTASKGVHRQVRAQGACCLSQEGRGRGMGGKAE